jgi:hypothetical protein
MTKRFRLKAVALALCLAGMGPVLAATTSDQTLTTQSTTMDQLSTTQEPSKVTSKFASDFATFAGSQQNAEAIITGLRNGTPITLNGSSTATSTGTTGTTTTTTTTLATITPPTKPMGYGETYISMSLAKAQLAQYGITEPTPEQLQAAMTGGSLTITTVGANGKTTTQTVTLDGVLTQRASGMGWGQIANANGFKLGQVISAMKSANKNLAATKTTAPTTTAASGSGAAQGKVKPAPYSSKSQSHARMVTETGRGITTAVGGGGIVYGKSHAKSGTQVASLNVHGVGGASHAYGAGIATAAGGSAAVHGNAGGKSASAPGQSKAPKMVRAAFVPKIKKTPRMVGAFCF